MEIRDLINEATKALETAGIADASSDVWILTEHFLQITRGDYYINPHRQISESDQKEFFKAIERRVKKEPTQHITGHQEFMGLDFTVNENVLIPRQDTELLVEQVVEYICNQTGEVKVLDMCTGSGCIAVSINKLCKNANITAVDISEKALEVAALNANNNNANINFVQSDLFEKINESYDVIVSNPPYIESEEIEHLMDEVKLHDPVLALDGDQDGLKFYRAITEKLGKHLNPGGMIFYEIGYNQAKEVESILKEHNIKDIIVLKDLASNDRVVIGRKE